MSFPTPIFNFDRPLVHQQDFSIIYPPHQQMGVLQTGTGRGK